MKKIMIIDDEFNILAVLSQFFSRNEKLIVETFSNPTLALSKVKSTYYDLVLSDIMMPSVDGFEILSSIKQHNPSIKVVLMTAYSNKQKVEKSQDLQVDLLIEKPFENLKKLEHDILKLLGV
jgi:CheY-like chemotaxis protein